MVYNATKLSSNCVFFRTSKLKPFKQRLTARKLIKDLECQAKINFNNLRRKVSPRRSLGAPSLNSVAFCTFATVNFEPSLLCFSHLLMSPSEQRFTRKLIISRSRRGSILAQISGPTDEKKSRVLHNTHLK